ncbi:MAG: 50S ribosomal protein L25/general stress protein Ctc [Bacteroidota bacterium]
MKSLAISGSSRDVSKKNSAALTRKNGNIPCVLYGGTELVHFSAPELAFRNLVYSPNSYIVELNVDGKEYRAAMREIQFHNVSDKILHIDFLELNDSKPVMMDLPIKLTGSSSGVKEGGKLVMKMRNLKVKALPSKLPDNVEIAIDNLGIGASVRVKDITIDGVELLDAPNNIIVNIKMTRDVVETPAAAAAAKGAAAKAAPAKAAAPKK